VAWGGHDVLATRDRALIPELLSLASLWLPLSQTANPSYRSALLPEQVQERAAMAAVLDALIQMNVPVPPDTLRTLAPDFGNDVAILLARMPDEESSPLAFDFYRSPSEHGYSLEYMSAALLALHPPPGFAADLLGSIQVRATVTVVVAGSEGFGRGSSSSCGLEGDFPIQDWPITGQYAFSTQTSDGAFLVVGGIEPIYATRLLSANYRGDACGMGVHLGPNDRRRLIAEMLGVPPEAIQWQTAIATSIEFQSVQQFDAALLAFVEEQQEEYRATAIALADHNLLTPAEAQETLPELELELNDRRGIGAVPISELPNLPSRAKWTSSLW